MEENNGAQEIENVDMQKKCIFCDDSENEDVTLSKASIETASKLNSWAIELQDGNVVKNISNMRELLCYHKKCFNKFSRKHDSHLKGKNSDNLYQAAYSEAVEKLVTHIQSRKSGHPSEPTLFKLSELTKTLSDRLNELGYGDCNVHQTRLKDVLLSKISGLRWEMVGRDVVLLFNDDIKHLIRYYWAHKYDDDDDDRILQKVAMKLRIEVLVDNEHNFDGSLRSGFARGNTAPENTIRLLNMVLYGENNSATLIASNLAQLIKFNSKRIKRNEHIINTRHVLCREQPLPLYCGLFLHA